MSLENVIIDDFNLRIDILSSDLIKVAMTNKIDTTNFLFTYVDHQIPANILVRFFFRL